MRSKRTINIDSSTTISSIVENDIHEPQHHAIWINIVNNR